MGNIAHSTTGPVLVDNNRAVIRLQWLTLAWITTECAVSLAAGVKAHSLSLIAFGGDSAIEFFSAFVVLQRFAVGAHAEQRAARIAAILLYALAAFICISSAICLLNPALRAEPSYAGIGLLAAAAIVMPWLGRRKRALAAVTCSRALKADAVQSSVCAYMSWIALAGLAVNVLFHLPWADDVAALLLVPLVLYEANAARKGKIDCC